MSKLPDQPRYCATCREETWHEEKLSVAPRPAPRVSTWVCKTCGTDNGI